MVNLAEPRFNHLHLPLTSFSCCWVLLASISVSTPSTNNAVLVQLPVYRHHICCSCSICISTFSAPRVAALPLSRATPLCQQLSGCACSAYSDRPIRVASARFPINPDHSPPSGPDSLRWYTCPVVRAEVVSRPAGTSADIRWRSMSAKSQSAGILRPSTAFACFRQLNTLFSPPAYPANAIHGIINQRVQALRIVIRLPPLPANRFQCRRRTGINMKRASLWVSDWRVALVHGGAARQQNKSSKLAVAAKEKITIHGGVSDKKGAQEVRLTAITIF